MSSQKKIAQIEKATALQPTFDKATKESKKEVVDLKYDGSRAINMMAAIIENIITNHYLSAKSDSTILYCSYLDEGLYHLGFENSTYDEEGNIETSEITLSDAAAIKSFLSDLQAFVVEGEVNLDNDNLTIMFSSKEALYNLLKKYIDSHPTLINCDNNISIENPIDEQAEKFAPQFERKITEQKHKHEIETAIKNANASYEKDPGKILYHLPPKIFSTQVARAGSILLVATYKDLIPFSMSHIYTTIAQEDNIDKKSQQADHRFAGGYH